MSKKDSKTIIRIEAKSNIYEFTFLVPENRAERVLKGVLKNYLNLKNKYARKMEVTKLKVTTGGLILPSCDPRESPS